MQTFLPYASFARSAEVLDSPRLGKQRVETLQILRALELPDYGWANHPAVLMWRGCTPALVGYGLACVEAWSRRGHADGTAELIGEFAPDVVGASQDELAAAGLMPAWLGDEEVHRSHRSALLRKDPETYAPVFGDEPDDLPYAWPEPAPPAPPAAPRGRPLWVVRPGDAETLAAFLADGVVGLSAGSGVDVDVVEGLEETRRAAEAAALERAAQKGGDPSPVAEPDLRALLKRLHPERRPGKELRQLHSLVHEVAVGDEVGLPIEGERALLVGEVVGDYAFVPRRGAPAPHRRPVRWGGRLARSAALPPAALQDPRRLFQVRVDA
ncbi:MSMEG_6728 family protein [uncultured Pseudokineococcus sp.]|uniref:MSMEG_6728 family protein n=1 Tax=uncultured Pseudokineococcus sp. TaxID=1642928 RepID=UPI0026020E3F|nr:MSMEG_6728 family protein [uncultured Pseudokineococcus sp.]